MLTTIAARHMTLSPQLRDRVESVLIRLGRFDQEPSAAEVVLDVVAGLPWVELRLRQPGGPMFVATATGSDHRTALDVADAKLRRQLNRRCSQLRADRHQLVG